jgi:hypothetical protein
VISQGCSSSTWSGAPPGSATCKPLESIATVGGMHPALVADMPDVAVLEAINREQLATATDRLLLRAARWTQRRQTRPVPAAARVPAARAASIAHAPAPHAASAAYAPLACGSQVELSHARRTAHPAPPRRPWFVVR